MKIAIIGCGDVGGAYGRALNSKAELVLCDIVQDGRQGAFANEIGLKIHPAPGDWLTECDVAIAAVPGAECSVAARDALPYMAPDALYLDVSTGAPADLRAWSEKFAEQQRSFVDVAIMSTVNIAGGATPVLIAGLRAKDAKAVFEMMGAPVTIMDGGTPGDAVALKLLRSVILKGLECLSIECLTAADKLGLRPQLLEALGDLDERKVADLMRALVTSHVLHAKRRKHEMEESAAQLQSLGFDAAITGSLGKRYDATIRTAETDPPEDGTHESLDASIAWLAKSCRISG